MKKLLTLTMLLFSVACFAQSGQGTSEPVVDTEITMADDVAPADTSVFSLDTGLGLYSRYFWRGVKFGTGPSVQGFMELSHESGFGIGGYVCSNITGSFLDFGNTTNLYIWYKTAIGDNSELTFVLDDYYFYNEDNEDRTFDYSDTTWHYIEARVEGSVGKLDGTVGYCIYQGDIVPDPNTGELGAQDTAPYIEIGYSVNDDTRIFAGGVTGASALNFQTKEGITNIGITHSREFRGLPVETTFAVNPAYENIGSVPGYRAPGRSAISLIVAITL
ncbi:MAG: hypothetical protein P8J32_08365 [bacterium]|nr:hypothetical protein [bacterium]